MWDYIFGPCSEGNIHFPVARSCHRQVFHLIIFDSIYMSLLKLYIELIVECDACVAPLRSFVKVVITSITLVRRVSE